MLFPPTCENDDYCYLTTIGRVSGRPRTIEVWFVITGATVYLLSGGGDTAHWVQNLKCNRNVEVMIRETSRRGRAHVVSAAEEDTRARQLLLEKYRPRAEQYRSRWGGDVERWGNASIAIAVELNDEADGG